MVIYSHIKDRRVSSKPIEEVKEEIKTEEVIENKEVILEETKPIESIITPTMEKMIDNKEHKNSYNKKSQKKKLLTNN